MGNPLGWVLHTSNMIPGVGVIGVITSADAALLDRPEGTEYSTQFEAVGITTQYHGLHIRCHYYYNVIEIHAQ